MPHDSISHWVERAKNNASDNNDSAQRQNGVQVIRRTPQTKGQVIMEVAEKIWPSFMKLFEGERDDRGVPFQPAHVRAIALNVAQKLVNDSKDAA